MKLELEAEKSSGSNNDKKLGSVPQKLVESGMPQDSVDHRKKHKKEQITQMDVRGLLRRCGIPDKEHYKFTEPTYWLQYFTVMGMV